jgi:hypothetical protein
MYATASKPLPLIFASLICILACYALLSIGIVDDVFIVRNRPDMLDRIEVASSTDPPDIEVLTDMLSEADWYVAAVAAERIGQLWQSNQLEPEQANVAISALFKALASGGHWWRFGWDRDEPEFEQFRGAAIEATAKAGPESLPWLLTATSSDSPFEREASCWIVFLIIKNNSVDQAALVEQGISQRIDDLAWNDPNRMVKAACVSAQEEMASQR